MEIRNSAESLKNLLGVDTATSSAAQQIKSGAGSPSNGLAGDQATVSTLGQEVAQAAKETGVRWEKVTEIQAALSSGAYQISTSAVAGKVVDALLDGTD